MDLYITSCVRSWQWAFTNLLLLLFFAAVFPIEADKDLKVELWGDFSQMDGTILSIKAPGRELMFALVANNNTKVSSHKSGRSHTERANNPCNKINANFKGLFVLDVHWEWRGGFFYCCFKFVGRHPHVWRGETQHERHIQETGDNLSDRFTASTSIWGWIKEGNISCHSSESPWLSGHMARWTPRFWWPTGWE